MKEKFQKVYEELGLFWFIVCLFLSILIIIGCVCLEVLLGVYLWNIIAVPLFGLPVITFWQFLGLHILIILLMPNYSNKVNSNKEEKK